MKKVDRKPTDELRRQYKRSDFGGLIRGKYAQRLAETTNVVVLEPEVAKAFPNDRAVNQALRNLIGNELRPEYDLRELKGVVRGKYYRRAMAGTNLVLLEPDVARAFPDSESVNRALRLLRDIATGSSRRAHNAPNGRRRSARR